MDDSKVNLNLGSGSNGVSSWSTSLTNVKTDVLNLTSVIQNTLLPVVNRVSNAFRDMGFSSGSGKSADSKNQVAPLPPTSNGGAGGTTDNTVASGANWGGRAAAGYSALKLASNAMPNVSTAVMQDFLTQRSAFYGQGGYSGSLQDQTGNVRSLQKSMARQGVAANAMDTTNALAAAQGYGLSGARNFNQVMAGVAQSTIFSPGISMTEVTQAIGGTMNAPGTVNLARTIGINIRDANGNTLPLPQLVDQLWAFLNKGSAGRGMNKKDMQYSLQPGYGLYNMLNGLFNGDQAMVKMVSDQLLAKASFGGASLNSITKDQAVGVGIMSATTRNIASQTAAQTNLLTSTSAATAGGYAASADIGTGMNNLASAMSDLTAALGGNKGFVSGTMGLGGGTMGSALKLGAGFAAKKAVTSILPKVGSTLLADVLPFLLAGLLADGGPAESNKPYIVGEVGPELFIPKTDGVVVSNKDMNSMHRDSGGVVKGFESNFFKDIKAPNTQANREILEQWMRYESGSDSMRWNNPMNSTLRMPGSTSKNKVGVQAYKTVAQGAQADANTLLNTKGVGYDKIIDAFRSGNDKDKLWSSIVQSGWVTGKADPTRTKYSPGSSNSTSNTNSAAGSATTTVAVDPTAASRFAAAQAAAFGTSSGMGTTSNNYNYGGVTIVVNGAKDPKKTADEINNALKSSTSLKTLGQK